MLLPLLRLSQLSDPNPAQPVAELSESLASRPKLPLQLFDIASYPQASFVFLPTFISIFLALSMSFFNCAVCSDPIPPTKARIRCETCSQYDLCASCFVNGKTNFSHQNSHDTILFSTSGHNFATVKELSQPSIGVPNPFTRTRRPLIAPPSLPPRPLSQIAIPLPYHAGPPPASQNTIPSLQQQSWPQSKYQSSQNNTEPQYQSVPPPAAYTPSPAYQTSSPQLAPIVPNYPYPQPAIRTPPLAENPYANPPYLPNRESRTQPQPQAQQQQQQQALPQASQVIYGQQQQTDRRTPTQWQALQTSGVPSPFLKSMLAAVFECVDVNNSQLLSPEQYSAFLDVQQYQHEEDVWKKFRVPRPGYNPEDGADYELRLTYENFGIDHKLQTRNLPPSQFPPISGGVMPMLTLAGFTELTFIELFSDETPLGWNRMNMILRHYVVWRELGDVPRDVWPSTPPQELAVRVQNMTAAARERTPTLIDANKVKLQLEQQG